MRTQDDNLKDKLMKQFKKTKPKASEDFRLSLRTRLLERHTQYKRVVESHNTNTFSLEVLIDVFTMQNIKRISIAVPALVLLVAVVATTIVVPQMKVAQAEEIARQNPQVQALLSEGAEIAHVELINGTAEVLVAPAYFVHMGEGGETATISMRQIDVESIEGYEVDWSEGEGVSAVVHGAKASDFATSVTDFVKVQVDFDQDAVVNMYAIPTTNAVAGGIELISETDDERVYKLPNGKTIKVKMHMSTDGNTDTATIFELEEIE